MDLTFGTGGLRAVMGNASHQMNLGVIREATRGVALYAREKYADTKDKPRIAIAYDSRHQGETFARETARTLALEGCKALIFPKLAPTPALAFAVRYLNCDLGICITASHNPPEYNGYKVYGPDGGQITEQMAEKISVCMQRASGGRTAEEVERSFQGGEEKPSMLKLDFERFLRLGEIAWIEEEVLKAFLKAALGYRTRRALTSNLKVVYTPLHGAGLSCVISILRFIGVRDLTVVPEQARPDGSFPTCPYPNPEEPGAMRLGIQWCEKQEADILLATDPDSDRVGVAARKDDCFCILSGNQVGILLLDYLLSTRKQAGTLPARPVVITTIVSTALTERIARDYGVRVIRTLTGFKYIGEQIHRLEEQGEEEQFIFGFEESCGYLIGPYVRDKDAVGACMAICEMADAWKAQGKTLWQRLEELYTKYGRFTGSQRVFQISPQECKKKMMRIRRGLKENLAMEFKGRRVVRYKDYLMGMDGLPPSDVLELWLENEGKVVIRPSGTEPKLKVYMENILYKS
ncbi:MAG: phospho-sugar mutase [Lachnospiraceae bacterium]|nr:phospho-sugar mutase [Lachnospiraceae bacterium]